MMRYARVVFSVGLLSVSNINLCLLFKILRSQINHRLREKWHWNRRIHELGGLDYNALEKKRQIEEGDTQLGGYRYFGAAKNLPGVAELLEKQKAKLLKKSRADQYKNISPDYYGWRDEEDGVLLEVESSGFRFSNKKRRREDDVDSSVTGSSGGYLDLPLPEQISELLLERKKKALLEKYSL